MPISARTYFGKIMLFGEYSVISQGRALSVPISKFQARLRFPGEEFNIEETRLNQQLKDYLLDLVHREETERRDHGIDLNRFALDLLRGLYLESDIPPGYGAGSSGALVAAVYESYACEPVPHKPFPSPRNMRKLMRRLGMLEAYFHGTSSGIDPLSCYLQKPLLIDPEQGNKPVEIPPLPFGESGGFFLVDTFLPRKTESLVNRFYENYSQTQFRSMMHDSYIPLVDFCIDALLEAHPDEIARGIRQLSSMQMIYFREMIPPGFFDAWNHGLETGEFYLKLCGAGGGGFLLGFTENYDLARKFFQKNGDQFLPFPIPE